MPRRLRLACLVSLALLALPALAGAQDLALGGRRPRFVAAWAPPGTVVDASKAAVLSRRVSLELDHVSLDRALRAIGQQAGIDLTYATALLPAGKTVSLHVRDITVAAALTEVLYETALDVAVSRTGQLAVVVAEQAAPAAMPANGVIVGRVTDAKTESGVVGATVVVAGARHSATTGNDGRYRIGEVAPGTYTVRARYIGYAPATASVSVNVDQEATADFVLEKSAQQLNEVVTTGTIVPTEVKALPTPVTIVTAQEIEDQHVRKIDQLFRQNVPGGVAPDIASSPVQTTLSVRGASSLNVGGSSLKVYVDGIEVADGVVAAIDPNSIERVEVIRGPEAAAIYGSDAIGGVMQAFTKHGDPNLTRPQADVEAMFGAVQTPYTGGSALRQQYAAAIRGGSWTASYNLGGGYTHTGDWLPEAAASNPSAFGGVHLVQGRFAVDLSARYYGSSYGIPFDPRTATTGFLYFSKPYHTVSHSLSATYGAHLEYKPTSNWRHTLTVGIDGLSQDGDQTAPRFTFPGDTLLSFYSDEERKLSVAYNTAVTFAVSGGISATVTAGFDHAAFTQNYMLASGAVNTVGVLVTDPSQPIFAIHDAVTNTGYFGQAQLQFSDVLFLTGAVRADQNSNFGSDLGTPLSPRAGIAYSRQVGPATLKVRGSYGEAIRAPSAGAKDGSRGDFAIVLPNSNLGPERQVGGDGGIDIAFGLRGSLSVTYYNQTARDLIQLALVDATTGPQTFQNQNISKVKNTGWEFEGRLRFERFEMRGQVAITRSIVAELSPGYTGDLRIGDQPLLIPRYTGGASFTVYPHHGMTLTGGLTYVGARTFYDYLTQFACFAGPGPCGTLRDYWKVYPGFAKLNMSITQEIRPGLASQISVENLANTNVDEFGTGNPAQGRITMIGLRASLR